MQIVNAAGIPVSTAKNEIEGRWLEVRLNSETDARAAVQNSMDILSTVKKLKFDGVEFLIARENEQPIQAIIGGAFNGVKLLYGRIIPRDKNMHYELPPLLPAVPMTPAALGRPEGTPTPNGADLSAQFVSEARDVLKDLPAEEVLDAQASEFDDAPPKSTPAPARRGPGRPEGSKNK